MPRSHSKVARWGILGAVAVATLAVSCGATATVEEGSRGVYVVMGNARTKVLEPGLHFKLPGVSRVDAVNVRQVRADVMATASSRDLQVIHTKVAINYKPDVAHISGIYSTLGQANDTWEDTIMRPAVNEELKAVTAEHTAEELITKRDTVKDDITQRLVERLGREHFIVTEVSISDFDFTEVFKDAIEAKQVAEQEAQRAKNELERHKTETLKLEADAKANANAARTEADSDRDVMRIKAEGAAEAVRIKAAAEAEYHRVVGRAVTPQTLRLRGLQKWDGDYPDVVAGKDLGVILPPLGSE